MPMLADMVSCGRAALCTSKGATRASSRRPAAASALRAPEPSTSTTNSSPPRRPIESDSRSVALEPDGHLAQHVVADAMTE